MKTLKAIQYTERCIAVIGDTKPLKDQLKQAGGKFNPYLKVNGATVAGWVFSVNRKDQIAGIIEGVTIEAQTIEVKPEQKPIETIKPIKEQKIKVFLKDEIKSIFDRTLSYYFEALWCPGDSLSLELSIKYRLDLVLCEIDC